MQNFLDYLKRAKAGVSDFQSYETIHVVLGNESCDLDSAASSLVYGFLLHTLNVKDSSSKYLVIPVLNTHEDDLPLKTETCFLLRKLRVDLHDLVFRNQVDIATMQEQTKLKITLVDHHILSKEDTFLRASVVEIYDHRPVNEWAKWDASKVQVNIQQVGSCSTIIASEVLKNDPSILNNGIATLLYETILFDTIGLKPEVKKAKELDIQMVEELKKMFSLSDNYEKIFDNLWTVHNDVSHLTPFQILKKDLKIVGGIPIPALPMLARTFLQLDGAADDLVKFCETHNSKLVVVMGIDIFEGAVRRDVAVFKIEETPLFEKVIRNLQEGDFDLEQTACDFDKVTYFTQENITVTRKQFIPLVMSALREN